MIKDLCFEIIETCPNNCLFCSSCSLITKTKMALCQIVLVEPKTDDNE